MLKKLFVIALAVSGFSFASVARSNAGTEVIEPQYLPRETYNYAPPPAPVVYCAPAPVRVVVYPTVRYYVAPVRVYGWQRRVHRQGVCYSPYGWR